MANEKIGDLPAGAPAQGGDLIPIARGTTNYNLGVSDIVALGGGLNIAPNGNTAGVTAIVSNGTLFLAGGNNVTLSQNSNSITISANTAAAANLSISAGASTGAFGGVTFSNANGISFGLANGTITASGGGIGVTLGGNTAGALALVTSGTMFLAGGNNVTLSQNGNSITISGATAAGLTTGGVYFNGNTTGQSSSSTYQLTQLNVSGAGIISLGWSASTLVISAPASTGATQSLYATGNTTQSSSGTASFGSLIFQGAGNVSVGASNGSVVISGAGGGGGVGLGVSTFGNTAGTTGTLNSGTVVLVGSGAVSLSQSTNTNGATISINGPALSSIMGAGLVSVSTNASTISISVPGNIASNWMPPYLGSQVTALMGNGTVQVFPALCAANFSATQANIFISMSLSTSSNSSYAGTLSAQIGLYTRNGSTLSLASSGSQSYAFTNTSNNSTGSLQGFRGLSMPINVNMAPSDLWIAVLTQTSSAGTNWFTAQNVLYSNQVGSYSGLFGAANVSTNQSILGLGQFTATSAALPASIAFSQIVGTNASQALIPAVVFNNVTA